MSTDRNKRVRTIKQILALAEHPGTPREEREAAFARAGALMQKYEIEDEEVRRSGGHEAEEVVLYDFTVSGRGGHGRERAWALGSVAKGMGCETAYLANDSARQDRWLRIVGPASTIDNLKVLLPMVLLQMENGAVQAARERAGLLPTWLTPSTRARETAAVRRSFMRGFGYAIGERLDQARAAYGDELRERAAAGDSTSAGRELVLTDRTQMVTAEFQRLFPKLGKPRAPKRIDGVAFRQGMTAGAEADLGDKQLREEPGDHG